MVAPLRSIINQALTGGWTMPEGFSDLLYRGGPGPLEMQTLPYTGGGFQMEPLAAPAAFGAWSGAGTLPSIRPRTSLSATLFGMNKQTTGTAQPAGSGRRLSDALFGPKGGATGGASGVAAVGSSPGNVDLWSAIDQVAGGNQRVALAMKVAAQMESGGRLDAVGDGGQSFGPFQIYQKAHGRNITPEQSRDPFAASRYMLPEFQSAVQRVSDALWLSDPARAAAQAAFFAERPAVMYPDARVRSAYATVTARPQTAAGQPAASPAQPGGFQHIVPGGRGSMTTGGTHGSHPAADIFAPAGTPIYAPVDGVSSPATYSLGGNATTMQGADGKWYYFAHALNPMRGGQVKRGDIIGHVGNSGNARNTPSHLHYAVASNARAFAQFNGSGDLHG